MNEKIMLSVFVAVEGAHAFSAFMPSVFTVRKFTEDSEDVKRLREGYAPAIAFNLVLGATVAAILGSPTPLVLSIITIVFMVALYEMNIQKQEVSYAAKENA